MFLVATGTVGDTTGSTALIRGLLLVTVLGMSVAQCPLRF